MLVVASIVITALAWYLRRPAKSVCSFRLEGVMLDGSVIEVCDKCTRVRVYIVNRDGEPSSIVEMDRLKGESAGDAILRVYREQHGGIDNGDEADC
jgi:hypothetical protein